jgi:hypothetical protein
LCTILLWCVYVFCLESMHLFWHHLLASLHIFLGCRIIFEFLYSYTIYRQVIIACFVKHLL